MLQGIGALLVGFVFRGCVVERLFRHDPLPEQLPGAVERDLIVGCGRACFVQIVLRLLHLLRTRAVLQFSEIGLGVFNRARCLQVLRAELVVFQTHEHLAFLHLVAFLDADPFHAARHF